MTNISHRVKKVRTALGLNQTEFAKRMQFTRHYVSLLERGKSSNPSDRFLSQLRFLEAEAAGAEEAVSRAKYSSACEEVQNYRTVSPPEYLPEIRHARGLPPPPHGQSSDENYAEAVKILRDLLENKPAALEALMFTLRAVHQTSKEKI